MSKKRDAEPVHESVNEPAPATLPPPVKPAVKPQEAAYTAAELLAGYAAFGVPQEIVAAVLRVYNIASATERDMRKFINDFKTRRVY